MFGFHLCVLFRRNYIVLLSMKFFWKPDNLHKGISSYKTEAILKICDSEWGVVQKWLGNCRLKNKAHLGSCHYYYDFCCSYSGWTFSSIYTFYNRQSNPGRKLSISECAMWICYPRFKWPMRVFFLGKINGYVLFHFKQQKRSLLSYFSY